MHDPAATQDLRSRLDAIYRADRPFPEVATEVLATVAQHGSWPAAALWVPDGLGRAMISLATWVADPRYELFERDTAGAALATDASMVGRAWRTETPLWIEDVAETPSFVRRDLLLESGLRAVSFTPLRARGQVLGVLELLDETAGERRPVDLDLATDVVDGISDLLETHLTSEQLRRQQDRLELALEAGRMGTWEWDRRTGHVLWSPTLEAMYGYEPGGFPGTFEAYQERLHPDDRERMAAHLAETIEHRRDHHVLHRIVRTDNTVRWIEGHGRPLLDAHGQLAGLTGVSQDVTEREQLLADLAEQVELTQQALADRSRVADALQLSLRPQQIPDIPGLEVSTGFRPGAEIVGGDFYDGFREGEDWFVYLGDVCGHGPEAAAQTGLARHAIRGLVAAGLDDPVAILRRLNRILVEGPSDRFVSLVLARVRPGDPTTVTLCRAGHPLPALRPAGGSARLLELVPGGLLGLQLDVELCEQELTLAGGDALVLYTDGVTESRRGAELLGEARLLHAVDEAPDSAPGIVNHLLDTIQRFAARPASDDVALLTLVGC